MLPPPGGISITIDLKFANRPDLIAQEFYGNAKLAWVVLQYNNIIDTIEELAVGKVISIPNRDNLFYNILTKL